MNLQFSWIIIPTALAGILGLLSSWLVWRRRTTDGSIPLALLFISISIWSISYILELIFTTSAAKTFWVRVEYVGIVTIPLFWLLFCLRYVNIQKPKTRNYFLIFSIIPLITLILAFTNSFHRLIWDKISIESLYGLNLLKLDYGAWFWMHVLYSHSLYLAGMCLLLQYYFKTPKNIKHQTRLIILAGLIPYTANLVYLSNRNPFPMLDLTPLSFSISAIFIVWILYYHRFLDIIPIARVTTIENMRDGIIVVDLKDRIVDINPAAETIIKSSFKDVVGQSTSQTLTELSDWVSQSKESKTPVKVLNIGEGKNKKMYVLNLLPLSNPQGQLIGHTIIFHNNTESHLLNKNLKDQADRLAVLYEIGKAITSTLEIDALLELIYKQLSRVISSDAYFVALYIPEEHKLDIKILIDQGKRYPTQKVDANEGLSSWIVEHRKPLMIQDLKKEISSLPVKPVLVGNKELSRSWLGVPMLIENNLIGLLAVASYEPHAFDETDQLLLEQIAQQAVLSIQNARHYEEVTQQAKLDSLTGVSNHNHFIEKVYEESENATTTQTPLSLIMLDIDYFKLYNDTYGHIIGDQVLRLTVQAIQSHIKKTDTVGRWGGEEFGVILPNTTITQASMVANRIRRTLSELPLFNVEGNTIPKPTISQGIGNLPDHTTDADDLVIIADRALFLAKNKGRDRVAIGEPSKSKDPTTSL
ncbi:MAG: histidine kinase N-terminal 7TM domain-containing protein [Anaerolineales bacterium]